MRTLATIAQEVHDSYWKGDTPPELIRELGLKLREQAAADSRLRMKIENESNGELPAERGAFIRGAEFALSQAVELDVAHARHQRDVAQARLERAIAILGAIHARLYPPKMLHGGEVWRFTSLDADGRMQELSDMIRALPDELARVATA